tara:strand:+ start:15979 stop:16164 length:186 start_codon:yes stop_codon:yes gene_type:complete
MNIYQLEKNYENANGTYSVKNMVVAESLAVVAQAYPSSTRIEIVHKNVEILSTNNEQPTTK